MLRMTRPARALDGGWGQDVVNALQGRQSWIHMLDGADNEQYNIEQ